MKYIRFKKFRSERDLSHEEARRLLALKAEVRKLKRQRILIATGACAATAIIVYLISR
jgi:hypothetical protein